MALMLAGSVVLPTSGWAEEIAQEQVTVESPQSEIETGNFNAYFGIYRDPITGEFGLPLTDITGDLPLDLSTMQPNLSTSSEGLKEEFAIKGKMVRLNGKFQDATIVTIDTGSNIVPTTPDVTIQIPGEMVSSPTQEQKE
jgi:hypothetical protein